MRTANEILDEIRNVLGLNSDTALGGLFGVKQSTVASWRTRNSIPYDEIIAFCVEEGMSLDKLLLGKGTDEININQPSLPKISPLEKSKLRLLNALIRVVNEGDEMKFKAIESLLDLIDPGEIKAGRNS